MENIIKNSYAYNKEFTGEPVPRMSKDCGDLLIQGSNNAGIHLTTEKFTDKTLINPSTFYAGSSETPPPQRKPHASAVDIFVTRKKSSLDSQNSLDAKINSVNNNCSNDYFNFVENNKVADMIDADMTVYDKELNDDISDATDVGARLYMSHHCDIDNIFGSNFDNLSAHLGPSILTYAQHNRVVGSSDVRLVSHTGQSFIDMDPVGNVVAKSSIDGGQQFLSLRASGMSLLHAKGKTRIQSQDEIHLAVRPSPTDEDPATEPYILHSELAPILKDLGGDVAFLNQIVDIILSALAKVPPVAAVLSPLKESVDALRDARDNGNVPPGITIPAVDLPEDFVGEVVVSGENSTETYTGGDTIPEQTISIPLEAIGNNITVDNFASDFIPRADNNIKSTKIFGEWYLYIKEDIMGHSQFKFKSSGFRRDDRRFVAKKTVDRPIGFKTPLAPGGDIFEMHTSPIKQLSDNFRNLVMTNNGERLGMFNFGANLNSVVFDYSNNTDFENIVGEAIISAANKYIPSISIGNITTQKIDVNEKNDLNKLGLAKMRIRINYTIPKFKSPNLALEVDLTIGG